MSDKEYYERLVSSSIDGALTEKEKEKLEAHLVECPSCAALKNDLERMRELFTEDAEAVRFPDTLHNDIMARVRNEARFKLVRPEKPVRRMPVFTMVTVAAAVVLAVLGGGLGQMFTMFGDNSSTGTASSDAGSIAESVQPESDQTIPETGGGAALTSGADEGSQETANYNEDDDEDVLMADDTAPSAALENPKEESASAKSGRTMVSDTEFPESLKGTVVSHCYIASGSETVVDIDGKLVANEDGASYFLLDNAISPVEETIAELEEIGYNVEAYEDVGIVVDSSEENWMLILR